MLGITDSIVFASVAPEEEDQTLSTAVAAAFGSSGKISGNKAQNKQLILDQLSQSAWTLNARIEEIKAKLVGMDQLAFSIRDIQCQQQQRHDTYIEMIGSMAHAEFTENAHARFAVSHRQRE